MMELDERGAGYGGGVDRQRRAVSASLAAPRTHVVSWGAIIAGTAVALIVSAMLNALGAGIGAAMIDTTARTSPDAQTFSMTTALWLACASALGLLAGGFVAARLLRVRDRTVGLLHGAGVWAVAFLLAVIMAGSAASGATVALLRGAGAATSGAVGALSDAAGSDTSAALVERLQTTTLAPQDVATAPREAAVAEAGQLLAARIQGEWSAAERARLETLVASLAGIPQPVAAERVSAAERAVQDAAARAEAAARSAADTAANAASAAALAAFATMLLGLVAALIGAAAGHRRDPAVETHAVAV